MAKRKLDVPEVVIDIAAGWHPITNPYDDSDPIAYLFRVNTMVGGQDHEHRVNFPPRAYYAFEDGCTISFRAERRITGVEEVELDG